MGKISYSDFVKKSNISVIIAEILFREIKEKFKTIKLSELIKTSSGGTPNRTNQDYYNGKIPWLKSGELNDTLILKTEEYITEEGLRNSSAKIFPKGTLLIAMYGATAGKTGILNIAAATNQAICAVFPKDPRISNEYLFWFFRAHRYYFIDISRGGAQPNISQSKINETLIPLIDQQYQKKIVEFLDKFEKTNIINYSIIPHELQSVIKSSYDYLNFLRTINNENDFQSKNLSLLRQSILQEAIEGKLTSEWRKKNPVKKGDPETDAAALLEKIKKEKQKLIAEGKIKKDKPLTTIKPEEIPFKLPPGWLWTRLGEVCTKITDGFHNTPPKLTSGKIYISATHIREQGINWDGCLYVSEKDHNDLFKKAYPQKGEILITNRGAGCGTPALIDIDENFSFQNAALIGFNQSLILSKYIHNFLLFMRKTITDEFVNGGLQPMLSNAILNTIPVPIPPIAEQRAIVERVDELSGIVDELEKEAAARQTLSENLMQAVLKEAFEGGGEI